MSGENTNVDPVAAAAAHVDTLEDSCKSDLVESQTKDGGEIGATSSKLGDDEFDSSSCSSCSTRRNSDDYESEFSDMDSALASLFATPSLSRASEISSPRADGTPRTEGSPLLDGIDILLQRITSERFAELRNIQLSERPVTGGEARGNIESFMRRAVHGPTEEEQIEEGEANRPEHVATEQNFLREQSVVQSSLQNEFRSILERTLMARLSPATQTQPATPQVNEQPRSLVGGSSFRSRLEALFGGRASSEATPRAPANNAPRTRRQHNHIHNNNNSNNNNNTNNRIPPPPPPQHIHRNVPQPPSSTASLPHAAAESPTSRFTIDAGMQLLAQSISDDLNRLESLHVVSGMLQGDFRTNLEQMVQTRITNENLAVRTEQFIRSLPGRRPNAAPTAHHAVSPSQAAINHGVTAELNSLKSQLDEMKRMLAMSMEIQMDTQRAVRQEVSAIFSSFAQQFAQSSGAPMVPLQAPVASTTVANAGQCVICCERDVDTVLYQCGHMCVCVTCGQQLKMDGHNCPMCRAPIRDVIRAYQTQTPQL